MKLILPALIPSWRFFDVIAPSPRIEFSVFEGVDSVERDWHEFRPRPDHLSMIEIIKRVFWNPSWNESLFMMSCAERIMAGQEEHSRHAIMQRICNDYKAALDDVMNDRFVQFRLVFVSREGDEIRRHVAYTSPLERLDDEAQI